MTYGQRNAIAILSGLGLAWSCGEETDIECREDDDCSNQPALCVAQRCQSVECRTNEDCSERLLQICVDYECENVACRTDADCPTWHPRCVDYDCVECRVEADCAGEREACVDGECFIPCRTDADCTTAELCSDSACEPAGTCRETECTDRDHQGCVLRCLIWILIPPVARDCLEDCGECETWETRETCKLEAQCGGEWSPAACNTIGL